MTRRSSPSLPKGATGIYRQDCSSSPPRFEDGTALTVVKKGYCIVNSSTGIEAIIRNAEILLDERWVMYQAPLPSESVVKLGGMLNDINSGSHIAD